MNIRKALVVTTALTAVGTLASGAALAAEKPKVSVGGYYELYFGISDQDDPGGLSTSGTPVYDSGSAVNRFGIVNYGEVHITAQGVTDGGMKWRVRFEDVQDDFDARAVTSPSQTSKKTSTDETWVELTGSWGRLILGGQDGPADGGYEGSADLVYTGAREHAIFADIDAGFVSGSDKTNIVDSSDATKIYYSTPRVAGFRAGYSFAPEAEALGSINRNAGDDGTGGPFHEAAIDYRGKIGDGMLTVALRGSRSEAVGPDGVTDDQLNAWGLSGNYTFGAFTVAAGYVDNDIKDGAENATAWDAGVAYNGGKWEASLTYLSSSAEDPATGNDDEYDQWVVSGVYNLGGGMTVAGSIYFFDLDAPSASVATDGWAGVVKTSFRF
jgi:hypothetical protein